MRLVALLRNYEMKDYQDKSVSYRTGTYHQINFQNEVKLGWVCLETIDLLTDQWKRVATDVLKKI